MEPDVVVNSACTIGENPLWHPDEQRLYWVDIPVGRLFRYDPATNEVRTWDVGAAVGGFTIQADGSLLLFMAEGAVKKWYDGELSTVIPNLPEERGNRFNDVIADPRGRVFCGTMSTPARAGRLYRLDTDGSIRCVVDGVGTSNGLGFGSDGRHLYYTDTRKQEIYLFDYDAETGAITNQRVFIRVPEGEGRPDGMTVDSEGCVWSARWEGSRIVRYGRSGTLIETVSFPVLKVSSLAFGGPAYSDIYVTSAGGDNPQSDGVHAGDLFYLKASVPGVPEFRSQVAL